MTRGEVGYSLCDGDAAGVGNPKRWQPQPHNSPALLSHALHSSGSVSKGEKVKSENLIFNWSKILTPGTWFWEKSGFLRTHAGRTRTAEPRYKQEGKRSHVGECFLLDTFPTERVRMRPFTSRRRFPCVQDRAMMQGLRTELALRWPLRHGDVRKALLAFSSSTSVKTKHKPPAFFHAPIQGLTSSLCPRA